MDRLKEFAIPVSGLKDGEHYYSFVVDQHFFRHFNEASEVKGNFTIEVRLEKKPDLYIVHFAVAGTLRTQCDRCLAAIALPVKGNYRLLGKFDESGNESSEVVYLDSHMHTWNIAQYVYEFILLSIPITKVYDCDAESVSPCDAEILKKLNSKDESEAEDSPWDILKNIEN